MDWKALAWFPLGYIVLWVFVWRHGPNSGTTLGHGFSDSGNRVATLRFAGWTAATWVIFSMAWWLLMENRGGRADLLMANFGIIAAWFRMYFRNWD